MAERSGNETESRQPALKKIVTADYTDNADLFFKSRIACIFDTVLIHHTFPAEFGILEVEQKRHFQTGDVQITDHLGDVCFIEVGGDFRIGNNLAIYIQVRNEFANEMAVKWP